MSEKTCSNCGSVYRLTNIHVSMRDKDTLECEICNTSYFSWNEAKIWSGTLIEKHENHLPKNED